MSLPMNFLRFQETKQLAKGARKKKLTIIGKPQLGLTSCLPVNTIYIQQWKYDFTSTEIASCRDKNMLCLFLFFKFFDD